VIDELGPEARRLLDAAREGMSPDAAAMRRVRARVGVATGSTAVGTALGIKLAVALVASVAVGVGVYLVRSSPPAAPRAELMSSSAPAVPAAPATTAAPAAPPEALNDDLITIETPPAGSGRMAAASTSSSAAHRAVDPASGSAAVARSRHTELADEPRASSRRNVAASASTAGSPAAPRRGTARGASGSASGAVPRAIDLAQEVEIVDLAMAALRRGDARAALAAVQRHAVETAGKGQLAEDAAAIEIEALCRLGDPSTGARLGEFDARFPHSAQRSRLTNRCP